MLILEGEKNGQKSAREHLKVCSVLAELKKKAWEKCVLGSLTVKALIN